MINYFWRCHAQNLLLATVLSTVACSKGSVKVDKAEEPAQTDACKDPDLNQIAKGQKVILCDGSTAEGLLGKCTSDGQVDCIAAAEFPAIDKQKIDTGDIRYGKTILGLTGTHRDIKQCRNAANLALQDTSTPTNIGKTTPALKPAGVDIATDELFWRPNSLNLTADLPVQIQSGEVGSTPPDGLEFLRTYYVIPSGIKIQLAEAPGGGAIDITSTGSGTFKLVVESNGVADTWETVDDYNGGLAAAPTASPWSSSYVCDDSNFTNVSAAGLANLQPTNTTPNGATTAFSQIWRDELTGLYFTNLLSNGASPISWASSIVMCASIDSGDGPAMWRIPTQKELLQLYIDGISRITVAGGNWDSTEIVSSTAVSASINSTWRVNLANGKSRMSYRDTALRGVICVR